MRSNGLISGERFLLMASSDNPKCCGRYMHRAVCYKPIWNCMVCGARLNLENEVSTSTELSQYSDQYEVKLTSTGKDKRSEEMSAGDSGIESLENITPRSSQITDYQPMCRKCGRVLGRYITRPWSVRCRRCKSNNTGGL